MPDTKSIVIVKEFTYRGEAEEFSNRYHFKEGTYNTVAAWKALADAIIAAEASCYLADVKFIRAYGYEAGTDHSVAQIDYRAAPNTVVSGAVSSGFGLKMPGDVAATIRWPSGLLNSRGKQIYGRKYMHAVHAKTGTADEVDPSQLAAFKTFGDKMVDGSLPQAVRYCLPQGAGLGTCTVSQWLTTRTLKRRGKRPLP